MPRWPVFLFGTGKVIYIYIYIYIMERNNWANQNSQRVVELKKKKSNIYSYRSNRNTHALQKNKLRVLFYFIFH
jgi:uncharacterized membrane protein